MIRVEGLTVHYGSVLALEDVSFELGEGECLLVAGPSGCGKSTLGRVLSGLIPGSIPAQVTGEVHVADIDVFHQPLPQISTRVGMVFQNPSSQLFHLRVEDEVAFGPRNLGLPESEVQQRVKWALEAVGLEGFEDQNPVNLSGGQKQRVAIASALAMRPQVLVLDEPTASLDVSGTEHVMAALKELRQRLGLTLVLIEHRLAEASALADRVLLLNTGRIVAQGRVDEVLGNRNLLRSLGLRYPLKRPWEPWENLLAPNGHGKAGSETILELQDVSAGYGRQLVIHDINLALYPGEFAALVG